VAKIRKYCDPSGYIPYDTWLKRLRDRQAKARILKRIDRLSLGLEGDWKSVGEGVRELRIPEGKGYRIYYAWEGHQIIILLCGGNKTTQSEDIKKAKSYWREHHG
jgi:putative addiction module killer protein